MSLDSEIQLNSLCKEYDGRIALAPLTTSIPKHKITCIMGPSGAGKSTLANLLLGLRKATSGSITGLNGMKCAAVFQENRLCEEFDAITNVKLAINSHISKETIKNEFAKVMLEDYEGKPVSQLSGGMKRRVAIIRAVLADSDLIVMDEPFKGLDEKLKTQVQSYIMTKCKGKTLIVITHDRDDVTALNAHLLTLK